MKLRAHKFCRRNFLPALALASASAVTVSAATLTLAKPAAPAKGIVLPVAKILTMTFPSESSVAVLEIHVPAINEQGQLIQKNAKAQARGILKIPSDATINIIFSFYGLEHLDSFAQLKAVNVDQINAARLEMDDKQAQILKNFPNLFRINFDNTMVSDPTCAMLANFKHLADLRISSTDITGSAFDALNNLPLAIVNMAGINLKPGSLSKIKSLPNTIINMNCSKVNLTEIDLAYLGKCTLMTGLDVGGNKKLDDTCVKDLINLKNLENLNISDTSITEKSLPTLAKLPKLHRLVVRNLQFWRLGKGKSPRASLVIEDSAKQARTPLEVFSPLH